MAWYNSVAHVVAQPIGWGAEAAGAALGNKTLTNVGHAITNPNVTLAHPLSLGGGGQSSFSYAPPASNPAPTQKQAGTGQATTTLTPAQQAAAAQTAQDNSAYNTYRGEANSSLGNLLNQYNTSVNSINGKYGQTAATDTNSYNTTKNNYDTAVTGQNQGLLRQTNTDREGVSNAYSNLMNLLGAYGGGASSVALEWAPNAAQTYQDKLFNGDKQTAASNLSSLAKTWGDYQNQFDLQKKQEAQQKAQDLGQAQADYNATKGHLNTILGDINNQSLTPGTIGTEIDNINASIPNSVYVQPSFSGVMPTFAKPSLASFESKMPTASINANAIPNGSSATPALYYLTQQQQQKNAPAVAPILNQQQKQNQVTA